MPSKIKDAKGGATPTTPGSPPRAAAFAQQRSPHGLFPSTEQDHVRSSVISDLRLNAQSANTLIAGYKSSVSAPDRVAAAQNVVDKLFDPTSGSDVPLEHLVEVLFFGGFQNLLGKYGLLYPSYNIVDEYFVNTNLPTGVLIPQRPFVIGRKWSVLGHEIGLPIGVPASVLTSNSRWIHYFARNGFNVLTYKTVRSRPTSPNQPPNWVFLPELTEPLELGQTEVPVTASRMSWVEPGRKDVSTANSFGVPSTAPEYWQADVEEALHVLHQDQLLIVSVMGDDYDSTGRLDVLADDYTVTALRAQRAGAAVIELNLSCPNSLDPSRKTVKPALCLDPVATLRVVATVREALDPHVRLVIKLAYMPAPALEELLQVLSPYIDGVAGINTLPMAVRTEDGVATFPGRDTAGVSGIAIRNHARDFVSRLKDFRDANHLRYDIIGMGGVTDVQSFETLFAAGADVVQTASGALTNPFLAWECVDSVGLNLPRSLTVTPEDFSKGLLRSMPIGVYLDKFDIAAAVPSLPINEAFETLARLAKEGLLELEHSEVSESYRRLG